MTQIGTVTCDGCGKDKVIGGRCGCSGGAMSVINLRSNDEDRVVAAPPAEPATGIFARAMVAARSVGVAVLHAVAPESDEPEAAPAEENVLPLSELMRQVKLHVARLQAVLSGPRDYDVTPPEYLDDIAVLKELARWIDEPIIPKCIDQLTPEQEADCEAHYDEESLAGILLRRLAHATHDKKLLAAVNAAAQREKWAHLRQLKEARVAMANARGGGKRAETLDDHIAALERELIPEKKEEPGAEKKVKKSKKS